MKLLLVDNAHLFKDVSGCYYTPSIYNDDFFQRYLSVFDSVRFVAKVRKVNEVDCQKMLKITDSRVEILELPWYSGTVDLLKKMPILVRLFRRSFQGCACALLRLTQVEGILAFLLGWDRKKPIAAEIVNDPAELPGINKLVRVILVYTLNLILKHCVGVSYVTKGYLQRKYPFMIDVKSSNASRFTANYSSIELRSDEILVPRSSIPLPITLVHSSNHISGTGKGHITAIHVVKELKNKGIETRLKFLGDGPDVATFAELTKGLGIEKNVEFVGRLSNRKDYLAALDEGTVFIFPSFSEGLPRVIIEAQARGLPCVASPVGGIVELVDKPNLVPPTDINGYVERILKLCTNLDCYVEASRFGIEMAKNFESKVMQSKRLVFYQQLLNAVEREYVDEEI